MGGGYQQRLQQGAAERVPVGVIFIGRKVVKQEAVCFSARSRLRPAMSEGAHTFQCFEQRNPSVHVLLLGHGSMEAQERRSSRRLAFARSGGSFNCNMNQRRSTNLPCDPFDAELEVIAALNDGEDKRLWRTLRRAPDEDRLLRVVADQAPRMLHRTRKGPYFSELLLVPVVEKVVGTVIGNEAT